MMILFMAGEGVNKRWRERGNDNTKAVSHLAYFLKSTLVLINRGTGAHRERFLKLYRPCQDLKLKRLGEITVSRNGTESSLLHFLFRTNKNGPHFVRMDTEKFIPKSFSGAFT